MRSDAAPARGLLADLPPGEMGRARAVFMALAQQLGLDLGPAFERLSAGASLCDALELPQGTADLLYNRAYHFTVAGRTDRAQPIFQVLTLMQPADAKHWLGLGIAASREGNIAAARSALEQAAALAPDWAVARYHLADVLMRSGEWTRAEAELATFDRLSKPDVPAAMMQEAGRLRLAISVGLGRAGGTGA